MYEGLEFGFINDEDLKETSVSKKYKFDENPTVFAVFMSGKETQYVRPTIKSEKMYEHAKKHALTNKDGVEIFSFGEYPIEQTRPKMDSKAVDTKKKYHNLCNQDAHIGEKLCDGKKWACFPTAKWATWIQVKPIEWIIDDENRCLISRYKIISLPTDDLNVEDVLNDVFAKDMVPSGVKKIKHKFVAAVNKTKKPATQNNVEEIKNPDIELDNENRL